MDYRSITAMALRLSGVLILVNTLPSVANFFFGFLAEDLASTGEALLLSATAIAIPLVVALVLIYFPARVGDSLRHQGASADQHELTARIGEIAFICLGLYFVATALFDTAYYLVKLWLLHRDAAKQEFEGPVPVPYDTTAGLVSCGFQLAIGLVLMFSASGLYRMIRRLRETNPKAENPT